MIKWNGWIMSTSCIKKLIPEVVTAGQNRLTSGAAVVVDNEVNPATADAQSAVN